MKGPLDGIKVIECTVMAIGSIAGYMLGDLGADVVKVERRTGGGDPMRSPSLYPGTEVKVERTGTFEMINRNKRGINLDLARTEGREILYRLVEKADIFLTNFNLSTLEKLGLTYETLSGHNPRLVYAHASGWGTEGPMRDKPAYDSVMASRAGLFEHLYKPQFMQDAGKPDSIFPPYVGALSDCMTGMTLVSGILAGLVAQGRQGVGQKVDVSGLGSLITLQMLRLGHIILNGADEKRRARRKALNPLINIYRCADDRWLALHMPDSNRYWPKFCEAMGIRNLEKDPRFANAVARGENAGELVSIVDKIFITKTLKEWIDYLDRWGIISGPLLTLEEVINDPQVLANDYIVEYDHTYYGRTKLVGFPYRFSKTRASVRRSAPDLGQHNEEVLLEAGYSQKDIARFKDEGII